MIVVPENINVYIGHLIAIGTEPSFTIQRLRSICSVTRL
jgi:hypothetical protein